MTYWDEIDPKAPPDPDAEQLPLRYEIIESERQSPSDKIAEENLRFPRVASPEPEPEPEEQVAVVEPLVFKPQFHEVWIPRIRLFFSSPTRTFATLGVALGVLFGVLIAAITWHIYNPTGLYDLGPVTSSAVGLRGRLYLKWDRKLQYRLDFAPSDPDQVPGFSLAAGNPPRPSSITIQLEDAQGFVLCTKEILFKYDARKAAPLAPPNSGPTSGKADAANAPGAQTAAASDFTEADAQEASREQGKDIFQNQIGPDGLIESASAEGSIPCSASAYENTALWGITPNFPSVAEQDGLLKREAAVQTNQSITPVDKAAARKRLAARGTPKAPPPFYIEGDDSIVEFDGSTGVIETVAGKSFFIGKASPEANAIKTHDLPIGIHYRCDQSSTCTLTSGVLGVLHTRLRK